MKNAAAAIIAIGLVSLRATADSPTPSVGGDTIIATQGPSAAIRQIVAHSDGSFDIDVSCSGCLIDVSLEERLSADDPTARRQLSVPVQFADSLPDQATFTHPDASPGALVGFDLIVLMEPVTEKLVEQRTTITGQYEKDGTFTPLGWEDWAVATGYATRRDDGAVDLGLISAPPTQAMITNLLAQYQVDVTNGVAQ